jgi:hypothetical protein
MVPRASLEAVVNRKIPQPLPELEPQIIRHVVHCCTIELLTVNLKCGDT